MAATLRKKGPSGPGRRSSMIALAGAFLLACAGPADAQSLQQVVREAQDALVRRDFNTSLARYGVAYSAVEQMPDGELKLYFRALVQLGIASNLGALRRFQEALPHVDAALAAANDPRNKAATLPLKSMMHHVRGGVLYNLGRRDEARAMFDLAGREGDSTAAAWLRALAQTR